MRTRIKCDFSGYATRNDLSCSDGRIIRKDAFKDNDGTQVPLVWQHMHNSPDNVLGHALLENRNDGVYAYCTFNETSKGQNAKLLVEHGDINALSIYANQLRQQGPNVLHGEIREVSLVLSGANPGALIDNLSIQHGDNIETVDDEAIIYTNDNITVSNEINNEKESEDSINMAHSNADQVSNKPNADDNERTNRTIGDVFDEFTEEQKQVVYALIGLALEDNKKKQSDDEAEHGDEEGENFYMNSNVFDQTTVNTRPELSHAEVEAIFSDAKRCGSLRDSVLAHAEVSYGIENIDYLFPDYRTLEDRPEFIKRRSEWVDSVMKSVKHSPFSRVKSVFANITADEARAKGYLKGKQKVEEVFPLLKRTTDPQTVYKKQKLDRDDVIDITSFDVVAWLKLEMREMLDEELARAILVGDGRNVTAEDKISTEHIRPIVNDANLFTVRKEANIPTNATNKQKTDAIIEATIRARKDYTGTGKPTFYTTEDVLATMLLAQDVNGRRVYENEDALATAMRVDKIVTVPVMDGVTYTYPSNETEYVDRKGKTYDVLGIAVNLSDYNVGADKGGEVNMFDDFDIDYNQQKYLIETRCSGALVTPHSAIIIEAPQADSAAESADG